MKATARRDSDEYVLNGIEDVHHERPLRRDDHLHLQARRGESPRGSQDPVVRARSRAWTGWSSRNRCARWAMHSSPTWRAVPRRRPRRDRPPRSAKPKTCRRVAARAPRRTFAIETVGCRRDGARNDRQGARTEHRLREASGSSSADPIGEFQLIQDKLARMEVARLNVENLVFRYIETDHATAWSCRSPKRPR